MTDRDQRERSTSKGGSATLQRDLTDEPPHDGNVKRLLSRTLIGLAVGVIAGLSVRSLLSSNHRRIIWTIDHITHPIGELFLRLLLMIVVPLVFSCLVIGVVNVIEDRKLGRVGRKSVGYRFLISSLALAIVVTLINLDTRSIADAHKAFTSAPPLMTAVGKIVPKNPLSSIGGIESPNMIHLMFFALMVGVASSLIASSAAGPLMRALEGLYLITAKVLMMIMTVAPYAVACLLFNSTVSFGLVLLTVLQWILIIVLLGITLHTFRGSDSR